MLCFSPSLFFLRDNLGSKTIKQKLTYRRNFPDCKKSGTAEAINVSFHRQPLIKIYSKVLDRVHLDQISPPFNCPQKFDGLTVFVDLWNSESFNDYCAT